MVAGYLTDAAAHWDARSDRKIYTVWLAFIWVGMIAGFGLDLPGFLKQQPPAPFIVHIHAAVFVSWLVVLTTQITLIQNNNFALHRRLGFAAMGLAGVMTLLGPATGLTVQAQTINLPAADPAFLALNFVDIIGFVVLVVAGYLLRNDAAAHKRLMILATVAILDPGYARITGALLSAPKGPALWFVETFYGNVILLVAMGAWDIWRRGRLHPAFVAGAIFLIVTEVAAALLYFDPVWKTITTALVRAWGYAG